MDDLTPTSANRLTPRELEVLRFIADGKTSKEIAACMTITLKTVETYRSRIIEKLDIHNARVPLPHRPVGGRRQDAL